MVETVLSELKLGTSDSR